MAETTKNDEPPDASHHDAFQQWLEPKPREWSVVIAARAALRVLPLGTANFGSEEADAILLPVLRANAIARFAALYPNLAIEATAAAAVIPASVAAHAAASPSAAYGIKATAAIRQDELALKNRVPVERLARMALWQPGAGMEAYRNSFEPRWTGLRSLLISLGKHWTVWTDWYDEVLGGSPPAIQRSEEWEAAFTDLPGPLPWDDGPEAVNLTIKARLDKLQEVEAREAPERIAEQIPDQSPAPVRVEERNGKIVRVHDRDSPLRAAERDFDAWREPVIDHIRELTSGDFREGTNHSRARDRLVALGTLLPGDLADVKEQQFRIGYEIERFEGLIAAYRSGGDDMPVLTAASLEDLDRLRIALKMGIDKLERWADFRRLATDDPRHEGDAKPDSVADALDQMAGKMERETEYFDPELPASFRFLAEAAKDPIGATKTVIYGAVKSAENVISFLGQRALGIGKNAVEGVEKHISKAVATTLLIGLSRAALELSGALPQGWAWLKPLLEALSKVGGG